MNFRRGHHREEPEINLIALIDVLLVILIFLLVTTSYSKYSELKINLPQANGQEASKNPQQIDVVIDAASRYAINGRTLNNVSVSGLADAMKMAAGDQKDPPVIINADAKAPHQAVINAMEAARIAGYLRITFPTQHQQQ